MKAAPGANEVKPACFAVECALNDVEDAAAILDVVFDATIGATSDTAWTVLGLTPKDGYRLYMFTVEQGRALCAATQANFLAVERLSKAFYDEAGRRAAP